MKNVNTIRDRATGAYIHGIAVPTDYIDVGTVRDAQGQLVTPPAGAALEYSVTVPAAIVEALPDDDARALYLVGAALARMPTATAEEPGVVLGGKLVAGATIDAGKATSARALHAAESEPLTIDEVER